MAVIVSVGWDAERRARALAGRRAPLLARLPHKLREAAPLNPDLREQIVDDAIEFAALVHYKPDRRAKASSSACSGTPPISACIARREGRYATVRAGYERADLAALDALADDATSRTRCSLAPSCRPRCEFAATLEPSERQVWACQAGRSAAPASCGAHADRAAARRADRGGAGAGALDRGQARAVRRDLRGGPAVRLPARPAIAALAAGDRRRPARAGRPRAPAAGAVPDLPADYTRHLRYLRSARFHGKVAALLPARARRPHPRRRGTG